MKYILKFQKENGLVADGIIGKITIAKMKEVFNINSRTKIAHFLGQVAEETGNFKYGVENLNYSAAGLRRIFSKYFNETTSHYYAHKPESIANITYANRLGNGDTDSGDGWRYRGRGAIQLTGKKNYFEFAKYIGDFKITRYPELVEEKYYWEVALWVFNSRNLWQYADKVNVWNIKKITRKINGGYNGLAHRISLTKHFYYLAR